MVQSFILPERGNTMTQSASAWTRNKSDEIKSSTWFGESAKTNNSTPSTTNAIRPPQQVTKMEISSNTLCAFTFPWKLRTRQIWTITTVVTTTDPTITRLAGAKKAPIRMSGFGIQQKLYGWTAPYPTKPQTMMKSISASDQQTV